MPATIQEIAICALQYFQVTCIQVRKIFCKVVCLYMHVKLPDFVLLNAGQDRNMIAV
jgi:hypothetical protein